MAVSGLKCNSFNFCFGEYLIYFFYCAFVIVCIYVELLAMEGYRCNAGYYYFIYSINYFQSD